MIIKRFHEFPSNSGSLSNDDIFLFMDNPGASGVTKKISLNEIADAVLNIPSTGIKFADNSSISSSSGNIIVNSNSTGALQRDNNGDPRGQYAVDWQNVRSTGTMVAGGDYSVIGGGMNNTTNSTSGSYSTIGGGQNNSVYISKSTIGGGNNNIIYPDSRYRITINEEADYLFVSQLTLNNGDIINIGNIQSNDSLDNIASELTLGSLYVISSDGGNFQLSTTENGIPISLNSPAEGQLLWFSESYLIDKIGVLPNAATIGGGKNNIASFGGTIGGGSNNSVNGDYNFVGGGLYNNVEYGEKNVICGGESNNVGSADNNIGIVVVGGKNNSAGDSYSFIGGGYSNNTTLGASIVAGSNNEAISSWAFIGNGENNFIYDASNGVIVGGGGPLEEDDTNLKGNQILVGNCSIIGGGQGNIIGDNHNDNYYPAHYSVINGGVDNKIYSLRGVIGGGTDNLISSDAESSTIAGGQHNSCSNYQSTIGGGDSNDNQGLMSTIGGGGSNIINNYPYCTVGGGFNNITNNYTTTICGGASNTADGDSSNIGGGLSNTTNGTVSVIPGGMQAKTTRTGELSHAAGLFEYAGDAQHTILIARRTTTDNTSNVVLYLDGDSGTSLLTLPPRTAWTFEVKISAYNSTNNDAAWWIIRGGIRRNATNGTALIGSLVTNNGADSNLSTASATVVADDTNDALEIRVTGVNNKTIRWVAVVDISQVSFGSP